MKNARRYDVKCRALMKKKPIEICSQNKDQNQIRDEDAPKQELENYIKESSV